MSFHKHELSEAYTLGTAIVKVARWCQISKSAIIEYHMMVVSGGQDVGRFLLASSLNFL